MGPGGHPGFILLQFGFRRFRSKAGPLLRLEHDILAAFENGKFVLAVLFDLQKGYDTTWKREVFHKLLSLGFCEHLPHFIRNLFVNRTLCVPDGNNLAPSFGQIEGVPKEAFLVFSVLLLLSVILLLLFPLCR